MTAITATPRRWQWPAELTTPRKARQATRAALASWQLPSLIDDAVLIISELVANACLYSAGPVTLSMVRTERGIRCSVRDPEQAAPSPPYQPEHGLGIVSALSRAFGVYVMPGAGKSAWFELDEPR